MIKNTNDLREIIEYIHNKIKPLTLNEIGKSKISLLLRDYSKDELLKAIDISYKSYVHLDGDGNPVEESISNFLEKIGGILHNNSLSPIEQKIRHIANISRNRFNYWDNTRALTILNRYVRALKEAGWTEEAILHDLNNEAMEKSNECGNWTQWKNLFESWTESLVNPRDHLENQLFNNNLLRINKEYHIVKEIGSGSFGITYLCRDERLDKEFVIKNFSSGRLDSTENKKFFDKFVDEIMALFDLHHQNIVSIYDYVVDKDNNNGLYIMEYIDGTNIEEYLSSNKKQINSIFSQLIDAFSYLESKKMCHRDIRINNILVNKEGEVKLIDFGFAKNLSENNSIHSATKLITYPYDWPEELKDKKQKYDIKTEIYFLGKLFEDLISRLKIKNFKYKKILNLMINYSYHSRIGLFSEIRHIIDDVDHIERVNSNDKFPDLQ